MMGSGTNYLEGDGFLGTHGTHATEDKIIKSWKKLPLFWIFFADFVNINRTDRYRKEGENRSWEKALWNGRGVKGKYWFF